ncbi:MAG: hydroxymethylglutaryl-CoA reductase [Chitinophagales bacterium]|jgi:hydroxymethylglutaryl-CoA reductase|nr:hydroxymethylglutaryl-CoA reductase [Chitinophagales bacterium]
MKNPISFSKLSKLEKISWVAKNFLYENPVEVVDKFASFWYNNVEAQKQFDAFSENTLTNFHLPFSVAPNFKVNDKDYCVPLVIEESSVVAALANSAKFWHTRGGIVSKVLGTKKIGNIHFFYHGNSEILKTFFKENRHILIASTDQITESMRARGGGISSMTLLDQTSDLEHYYSIRMEFETKDSMGANFINTCLEQVGKTFRDLINEAKCFDKSSRDIEINMCILSNYTPECIVNSRVSSPIADLGVVNGYAPNHFAEKFVRAVDIARVDTYRATTHNKGILNGIDAVVIATGNDFRAVESCIHTYASRDGKYRSLSRAYIEEDVFHFELTIPMALGTVGGLTKLHPMANTSLQLLGNPDAEELMQIVASVGLMQNFAAIRSLITTGIQFGHMKMHLPNILHELKANVNETSKALDYFKDKVVSFNDVKIFLQQLRSS